MKPCPFCGGEARIIVVEKGVHSIIECTTHYCGFMRHSFNNGDTDENAALRLATAWNTRTPKESEESTLNCSKDTLKSEVAREIFEELEAKMEFPYIGNACMIIERDYDEIKKKYTEGEKP